MSPSRCVVPSLSAAEYPVKYQIELVATHERSGLKRLLCSILYATIENVEATLEEMLNLLCDRNDYGFFYYSEKNNKNFEHRRLIVSRNYTNSKESLTNLLLNLSFLSSSSSINNVIRITLFRESTITLVTVRSLARVGKISSTKYAREDVSLNSQTVNFQNRKIRESTFFSFSEVSAVVVSTNEYAKHTAIDCCNAAANNQNCFSCLDCIWVDNLADSTRFDDDEYYYYRCLRRLQKRSRFSECGKNTLNTTASSLSQRRQNEVLDVPRFFLHKEPSLSSEDTCISEIFSFFSQMSSSTSSTTIKKEFYIKENAVLQRLQNENPRRVLDSNNTYCPWHAWAKVHTIWLHRYIVDDWSVHFGTTNPPVSPFTVPTRNSILQSICKNGFYTCGLYEVAYIEKKPTSSSCRGDDDNGGNDKNNDFCRYRRALLVFERDSITLLPLPNMCHDDDGSTTTSSTFDDEQLSTCSRNKHHEKTPPLCSLDLQTEVINWMPRRYKYENINDMVIDGDDDKWGLILIVSFFSLHENSTTSDSAVNAKSISSSDSSGGSIGDNNDDKKRQILHEKDVIFRNIENKNLILRYAPTHLPLRNRFYSRKHLYTGCVENTILSNIRRNIEYCRISCNALRQCTKNDDVVELSKIREETS